MTPIKEEIVRKGSVVKTSVLLMVIFLLVTLLTGFGILYVNSLNLETNLDTVFGFVHRISAFAGLCLVGYNIQLIAPWFFAKAKEKLDTKGIFTVIISGLFLLLLITIIVFEPEIEIKNWVVLHANAGIGFFISLIFYILLHNDNK
ncbi:hypothetical protein D0T85_02370 [Bacteroides sp. 519]|nr:hypothetical protein [Bacteroides sp. 519]